MANKQIVVKSFPDLPTVTLKIFPEGLGAPIETQKPLPDGNDGSLYVATFSNLSEARYRWNLYSEGELVTDGFVTVTGGTGPHFEEDMLQPGGSDLIASEIAERLGGSGLAAASATLAKAGTIAGMPSHFVIGDAYVESNGRYFDLFVKTAAGQHVTAFGSKQLKDAIASLRFSREATADVAELVGDVTWSNPGGDVDPYFRCQIPSSETAKAKPVVDYCWQLVLNWDEGNENETTPVDSGRIHFTTKIAAAT